MSSRPVGLCNLDYAAEYEAILKKHMPEHFSAFADFFAGTQRLHTLAEMLSKHITEQDLNVLNVGCGPFATEIFVDALQGQNLTSLDYTPEFAPFFDLFREGGYLQKAEFMQADIMQHSLPNDHYDLIILHDILYEKALDMSELIAKLMPSLKPGGFVFLDFVNARTGWIWRVCGKPDHFRRYDPEDVRKILHTAQCDILAWAPTNGSANPKVRALHRLLWAVSRSSNNYAVLARLKGS